MDDLTTLINSMKDLGWDMKNYQAILDRVGTIEKRINRREDDVIEVTEDDLWAIRFACDVMQFLLFRIEEKI
jgi:hypothetical protein